MFTPLVVLQDQALKDASTIKPQETITKKAKQTDGTFKKDRQKKEFVSKKGNRKNHKFSLNAEAY